MSLRFDTRGLSVKFRKVIRMKHTGDELKKLWSNNNKRRAFVEDYTGWEILAVTPQLGLKYYKYDLPDESRIIVLEFMQKSWRSGKHEPTIDFFLQLKGKLFNPHPTNIGWICEHLKDLKKELISSSNGVNLNAEFMVYGKHKDNRGFRPVNLDDFSIGVDHADATRLKNFSHAVVYANVLTEKLPDFMFQVREADRPRIVYIPERKEKQVLSAS